MSFHPDKNSVYRARVDEMPVGTVYIGWAPGHHPRYIKKISHSPLQLEMLWPEGITWTCYHIDGDNEIIEWPDDDQFDPPYGQIDSLHIVRREEHDGS